MARPLFSVVIPTRDRPESLIHCLRTCIQQQFADCEFVVSDNSTLTGTRAVVDSLRDARIRYLRTPRALAMSDSWDFGVGHAAGEYVLVLGDDDGLLFDSMAIMKAAVEATTAAAITWPQIFYTWPNYAIPRDSDYLRIPVADDPLTAAKLRRPEFRNAMLCKCDAPRTNWIQAGIHRVTKLYRAMLPCDSSAIPQAPCTTLLNGPEVIREVIRFDRGYWELPMIYNSVIHRSLLDDLRSRVGRLFPSAVPDVFSGFAFAYLADRFAKVSTPLSISGVSGKSTGVAAQLMPRGQSPIEADYYRLNETATLVSHPWAPNVPSFPYACVADSFLVAKQCLFAGDDSLRLDRRDFIEKLLTGLRVQTKAEFDTSLQMIRASLSDSDSLQSWFDDRKANHVHQPLEPFSIKPQAATSCLSACHFDAKQLGINNVFDVAEFHSCAVGRLPTAARRLRAS